MNKQAAPLIFGRYTEITVISEPTKYTETRRSHGQALRIPGQSTCRSLRQLLLSPLKTQRFARPQKLMCPKALWEVDLGMETQPRMVNSFSVLHPIEKVIVRPL